jgi:hypothetical protein
VIARTVSGTVVDGTLMDPAEVGWDADWRWSDVQVLEA